MCFDVSSHHHLDIILHHHFHSCYQHLFKHQLPTCIYSVLAADEGLRGRNVLFTNSVLRPLLKVSQTSKDTQISNCSTPHRRACWQWPAVRCVHLQCNKNRLQHTALLARLQRQLPCDLGLLTCSHCCCIETVSDNNEHIDNSYSTSQIQYRKS